MYICIYIYIYIVRARAFAACPFGEAIHANHRPHEYPMETDSSSRLSHYHPAHPPIERFAILCLGVGTAYICG